MITKYHQNLERKTYHKIQIFYLFLSWETKINFDFTSNTNDFFRLKCKTDPLKERRHSPASKNQKHHRYPIRLSLTIWLAKKFWGRERETARSRPREKSVGMEDSAKEMKLLDTEALKIGLRRMMRRILLVLSFLISGRSLRRTWKLCEWQRQRMPWIHLQLLCFLDRCHRGHIYVNSFVVLIIIDDVFGFQRQGNNVVPIRFFFFFFLIKVWTKFNYKINCNLRLQTHSISLYWKWILTNPPLNYIFFLYPPCLQNFKKIKDQ